MHCFSSGPDEFGVPDPELGFTDERHVTLGELIGGVGDRLRYAPAVATGHIEEELALGGLGPRAASTH